MNEPIPHRHPTIGVPGPRWSHVVRSFGASNESRSAQDAVTRFLIEFTTAKPGLTGRDDPLGRQNEAIAPLARENKVMCGKPECRSHRVDSWSRKAWPLDVWHPTIALLARIGRIARVAWVVLLGMGLLAGMGNGWGRAQETALESASETTKAVAAEANRDAPTYDLTLKAELGSTYRVKRELTAEGTIRAETPPSSSNELAAKTNDSLASKPLKLQVRARMEYDERIAAVEKGNMPARAARRVRQAGAAIRGEVRPSNIMLRPQVATLVAERRDRSVFLYSPGGPLTRAELDLARGPGDPLGWIDLLPNRPVAVGETWTLGETSVRELTDYDALASHTLEGTLVAVRDGDAEIRFRGLVNGVARGGEGKVACSAALLFNLKTGTIRKLVLNRNENRAAGPVETALTLKSTLTIEMTLISEPPAELNDAMLADLPSRPPTEWEELFYESPGGKFTLTHDRDWHLFWDDAKLTVLKRLQLGELVAQVNLSTGPNAGPGRHQDVVQFENDVKTVLGNRFREWIGKGEVQSPHNTFLYKVSARGVENEIGVIWTYFLAAGPQGDQLLGTFILGQGQLDTFSDQDDRLMKNLRFIPSR